MPRPHSYFKHKPDERYVKCHPLIPHSTIVALYKTYERYSDETGRPQSFSHILNEALDELLALKKAETA
jgi:hypothetical protein